MTALELIRLELILRFGPMGYQFACFHNNEIQLHYTRERESAQGEGRERDDDEKKERSCNANNRSVFSLCVISKKKSFLFAFILASHWGSKNTSHLNLIV